MKLKLFLAAALVMSLLQPVLVNAEESGSSGSEAPPPSNSLEDEDGGFFSKILEVVTSTPTNTVQEFKKEANSVDDETFEKDEALKSGAKKIRSESKESWSKRVKGITETIFGIKKLFLDKSAQNLTAIFSDPNTDVSILLPRTGVEPSIKEIIFYLNDSDQTKELAKGLDTFSLVLDKVGIDTSVLSISDIPKLISCSVISFGGLWNYFATLQDCISNVVESKLAKEGPARLALETRKNEMRSSFEHTTTLSRELVSNKTISIFGWS